jgi:hypothetical protein
MTILSFQRLAARRLAARPRRRPVLPRHLDMARRRARSAHRTYHDPFFADPAAVEDDARRLGSSRAI